MSSQQQPQPLNLTVCQLCFEDFDYDVRPTAGAAHGHRMPVSCNACPNTICYACYLNLQMAQTRNIEHHSGIRCPKCKTSNGFSSREPVLNRALACLLQDMQTMIGQSMLQTAAAAAVKGNSTTLRSPTKESRTDPTTASTTRKLTGVATAIRQQDNDYKVHHSQQTDTHSHSDRSTGSRRTEIRIKSKAHPMTIHMNNPCGLGLSTAE